MLVLTGCILQMNSACARVAIAAALLAAHMRAVHAFRPLSIAVSQQAAGEVATQPHTRKLLHRDIVGGQLTANPG
jgi:hypothetical protein